jgi:hypothetical protein
VFDFLPRRMLPSATPQLASVQATAVSGAAGAVGAARAAPAAAWSLAGQTGCGLGADPATELHAARLALAWAERHAWVAVGLRHRRRGQRGTGRREVLPVACCLSCT